MNAIRDRLVARLGDGVAWHEAPPGDPFAVVPRDRWVEACRLVRDDEALAFDFLRAQTGIDYPETKQIEIVAHLFSYKHRHALVLKTHVDRDAPHLATIEGIWPAANWYEREIWDLLGVRFDGHPDLRRLVLPEDWEGHPLRRDYQKPATYQGIPTTRPGYPRIEFKAPEKEKPAKAEKPAAEKPAAGGEGGDR